MVGIYIRERVPNSPFLNEDFYCVFEITSTFTGAFCTIASVVAPIGLTGGSYAAVYPAGTVATGTYTIYGYVVKGSTGTFVNNKTIQIRNSEIADPVATVYSILKNNLGGTYSSTLVSTGWYNRTKTVPQITVTSARRTDETYNLNDTFRNHEEILYVDTWISGREAGASLFGTTSLKRQSTLLDDEVKRIINSQRKAPSTKLRHMQIRDSQPLDEVSDNRKVFRTRHAIRIGWDETIA